MSITFSRDENGAKNQIPKRHVPATLDWGGPNPAEWNVGGGGTPWAVGQQGSARCL